MLAQSPPAGTREGRQETVRVTRVLLGFESLLAKTNIRYFKGGLAVLV